jgi:broad specificity phosphatase PhoE
MKEILVLRHAEKDASGNITDKGRACAKALGARLGDFDIIISSPKSRAVETAVLLVSKEPTIDRRAGAIGLTPEETMRTHEEGKKHQFGIAGVLFANDEYRPKIIEKGRELVELIKETLNKLSDSGRALIISHDGVMVAADMILRHMEPLKAEKTFEPLQGFRIFEDLSVEDLK